MKYGRQRWKLRGRIESSGKQVWDSEETVFLPLLTEFLSIKVMSLPRTIGYQDAVTLTCEPLWTFMTLRPLMPVTPTWFLVLVNV